MFQPFRVTGAQYQHRVGNNRVRDYNERKQDSLGLSAVSRTTPIKARQRRHVEEGKRQLFHEVLASWRLFSDRHGDGRDFVAVFEHQGEGPSGGSSHRKPATKEFLLFLSQFVLVASTSGTLGNFAFEFIYAHSCLFYESMSFGLLKSAPIFFVWLAKTNYLIQQLSQRT